MITTPSFTTTLLILVGVGRISTDVPVRIGALLVVASAELIAPRLTPPTARAAAMSADILFSVRKVLIPLCRVELPQTSVAP